MEYLEDNRERQTTGSREFITVVFKHKAMILAVFLAVVMIGTIVTLLTTPVYESEASILVKIGREYLNHPEIGNNAPVMSLNQEEVINSEIQILKNRDLIEKVIASLTLEKIYPELLKNPAAKNKPMDAAILRFQKALKVEAMKKSNVLQVSFRHRDPQITADAINRLIDFYREKHLQVFSDTKSSFLETQLVAYDQKLRQSENTLQNFKQKKGVYSLDEQRSLLLRQRSELDAAVKTSQNVTYDMEKRIVTLKENLKNISNSPTRYTNSEKEKILVDAKSKLLALQLNERDLLKKYTENNWMVMNTRRDIEMVKNFLKEQEADINSKVKTGNQVYQNTEMQLISAETELNAQKGKAVALQQQLAEIDGKVRSLDFSEKELQQLKREQAINEKNFQTYAEKAEEARITDDMNRLKMANISVIQKAVAPAEPIKPKKRMNIALSIVIGLVAALGMAFLSESRSQSFSTPEQVENRLYLPVLAAIAYKEE